MYINNDIENTTLWMIEKHVYIYSKWQNSDLPLFIMGAITSTLACRTVVATQINPER